MKKLVKLSIEHPKKVLFTILVVITLFFAFTIYLKFAVETSPDKSFSRKLDVVKFYHLTQKKFEYKDYILIGIENNNGTIFNVKTLRYMENVIKKFRDLKIKKQYNSVISGREETAEVSSEISSNDIMSIINAENVAVDKKLNTIIVGNLTSKARKKAGLITSDETEMKKFPVDDGELERLIPFLQKELRNNKLLIGTLISADEKAAAILVPIEKKLENKLEIIRNELYCMISDEKIKRRFSGRDFYFPYNVYNKEIDGNTVDDSFINELAQNNRDNFKKFIISLFKDQKASLSEFFSFLKAAEVNEVYIDNVLKMIEADELYEISSNNKSYEDFIDEVYGFVVDNLDIYSRDNLESKIYSIKDIYDVGFLYDRMYSLVHKDKPENISVYIAGRPVAEALIEWYVINDMTIFLYATIFIILLILFFSFKTISGIFLPVSSVLISTIWVMGLMLLFGQKFTSGTIPLPTILIAVGSAYIIHYISRYFEGIVENKTQDVKKLLLETTDSVSVAINLAAITTIAAFLSVISSAGVVDVKVLGILTSIGIIITVILTYSFIPAILVLLPRPKFRPESIPSKIATGAILRVGNFTYKHSRTVFLFSLFISAFAVIGIFFLKTESSVTTFFEKDNPILVASKFIDKNLTGTGQMSIVFKIRDRVNIASESSKRELIKRLDAYQGSYIKMLKHYPELKSSGRIISFFGSDFGNFKINLKDNLNTLEERINIFADILNDYYEVEDAKKDKPKVSETTKDDAIDILSLSDSSVLSTEGDASETHVSSVDRGIDNILKRVGIDSDRDVDKSRLFISNIRKYKNTEIGREFHGKFLHLSDFFKADFKQPLTLKKIDKLGTMLKELTEPRAFIDGVAVNPVGNILSITDTLKIIYKVFYHNGDESFNKIPDVQKDGIFDKSLTDRSIIGVCLNQLSSSNYHFFRSILTDDLKLMQFMVFVRSDKADFLKNFSEIFYKKVKELFPEDDPYVEKIVLSGMPAINMVMNRMLFDQQLQSILITIGVVFLVCLFIFRSLAGGILSIIPISLTVLINLGIMGWLGFPINYSTVIIASIAIGAGIDYTIHFIERFKSEHLVKGHDFEKAYNITLMTTGKAILISAISVAAGFAVMTLSNFRMIAISGLMVSIAMLLSSIASLTVLPALINWIKPEFLEKNGFRKNNNQ